MKRLSMFMLTFIFMIAGCGNQESAPKPKGSLEKIKMASWSKPIVEQSNLYVANEKDMFIDAGIDFEYIPGAGGGDAVKNIIAGNADIAFANIEAVLLAAEKGAELKVIYNIYPENVFNVVSLKNNKIESVKDLKGKDVGVYSLASGTYQNLKVLLYSAGMTEKDVNIIETGVLNFAPLMNGQVAATAATDTGFYDAKQKGLGEVNVIDVKDVLNTPSDVFVVTKEMFEQKKELIQKFLQVYKDSVTYTMENPEEAAKIAVDAAIDGEDEKRNLEIIKIRNQTSENGNLSLGVFDLDVLSIVEQTYVDMGLLKQKVGVNDIFTNELVENLED